MKNSAKEKVERSRGAKWGGGEVSEKAPAWRSFIEKNREASEVAEWFPGARCFLS